MQASSIQPLHNVRRGSRNARPRPRYGADFEQHLRGRDGHSICISALRPGHASALAAGFERLSVESRYYRFMIPKHSLSEAELRYFTRLDGKRHYGLVARVWTDHGWDGAGVARIVQIPEHPDQVEVAITILDEYQGIGLGSMLLERIMDAAAERGYRAIVAEVLAENRAMIGLFRRCAPDMRSVGKDARVLTLVADLSARSRRLAVGPRRIRSAA